MAEFRYAVCHYAQCHKFFVLSVIRLNVVMLSVVAQIGIPFIINTIKKPLSWFALVRVLKFETF